MDDYEPYLDEGYEIESALGSAGMGTDEYYQPATDLYAEADLAAIFETPVKEGEE